MKIKKYLGYALGLVLLSIGFLVAGSFFLLRGSLPITNGELFCENLSNLTDIQRDERGIPTIRGETREDVAFALGFLHAQDRFFQIDIMRRAAGGELSELFGEKTLEFDKLRRIHRFRSVAMQALDILSQEEKLLLNAYTCGVNKGLQSLKVRPFEYLLLNTAPTAWKPEDSLLVGLGLFLELQDSEGRYDLTRGVMQKTLPAEVNQFFTENGSEWDASLNGAPLQILNVPEAEHFSYLNKQLKETFSADSGAIDMKGSNQWAVSGKLTEDGKALLACDMHLTLSVPTIWYRSSFIYKDKKGILTEVHGATLPGTPLMIIGSNRHIAWGFTNSFVDTTDIAIVGDASQNTSYKKQMEWIQVKGREPVAMEITTTPWGPILDQKFFDQAIALLWVAHDPRAVNMRLIDLETTRSAQSALEKSKEIAIPLLNFIVADKEGHIGWTLIGKIPERAGFDGKIPEHLEKGWNGFMDPSSYPVVYDPQAGSIVTANNRVMGGEWQPFMGTNGFLNGIRSFQINKRLKEKETLHEEAMLNIQLDDEAIFFQRWKTLLQNLLLEEGSQDPRRQELLRILDAWDGKCSKCSSAYYWTRSFYTKVANQVLTRLLEPCFTAWKEFKLTTLDFEEPLWLIVSTKPQYLVSPQYKSWNEELLAYLNGILNEIPLNRSLSDKTWGTHNTLMMNHPLSQSIPFSDRFLNMPHIPVSGDYWVPRVTSPKLGSSERMVVAPGNEENGIFHAPQGQSGHPLSPNYRDAHRFWVEGLPDPLLPGKPVSMIKLIPHVYSED